MRLPLLCLAVLVLGAHVPAQPPELRGLVLPLYAQDPAFDYRFALREIAATGANSVNLPFVLLQKDKTATRIRQVPGRTVPDEVLVQTIRQAREADLSVMLLPIVLLENEGEGDWRGNIAPSSAEDWWSSYSHWILHYARIAQREQCAWFSVGSEFSSIEDQTDQWKGLIAGVRDTFDGKLIYSCNWDHLEGPLSWWRDLDAIGLSSYYELTDDPAATQPVLDQAWLSWKAWVLDWRNRYLRDMPVIFTEVGYPSMDGAAIFPWEYTLDRAPDLEEQRRAYQAFITAWDGEPALQGVYFYKWITFDEDDWISYTPRGKPAEFLLRAWYGAPASSSPALTD